MISCRLDEHFTILGLEPLDEPLHVGFLEWRVDFGIDPSFPLGLRSVQVRLGAV